MNRTGLKYYLRALGIGIIVTALLMGYSQKGQAQMTDEEIRERAAQLGMREQQGVLSELATASPEVSPAADPTVSPTYWSTAASTGSPTSQPAAEPAASPTPQPAAEPTASPTPQPAASPTPQPAAKPTASPTPQPAAESTASPTPQPAAKPTASPTPQPAAKPTASPTPQPAAKPTASPTPQPAAKPTASPTPQPAASLAPAGDVVTLVINRGESSVTVSKNLEELGLVEDYWAFDRYLCENGFDHSIGTGTYEIPLGTAEEEIARIICNLR